MELDEAKGVPEHRSKREYFLDRRKIRNTRMEQVHKEDIHTSIAFFT
jgi:hypothetical protein